MGCGSSGPDASSGGAKKKKNGYAEGGDEDAFKAVHSAIRWNKSVTEVQGLIDADRSLAESRDPKNGNFPMHIAAQNGHTSLARLLHERYGASLDCENGTGQRPLHMSLSYGYYFTVIFLVESGCDQSAVNKDGHPASKGIDGDKDIDDPTLMLECATNAEEVRQGLDKIQAALNNGQTIDKGSFVQTCMGLKKKLHEVWNDTLNRRWTELAKSM